MEQPVYPASAGPAFNLASGPAGATAATLAALSQPILHHLDPAFGVLYAETAELLQRSFGTLVAPVILPGEAVVGLEAAAASLIGPQDVVLNLAEHEALLIVDAVSTFGGVRCDFTGWQADLVVTAPQKCLGGPPGLSLLHVSEAAWDHMAANPDAPRGSALSILDWRDAHRADRPFPFTPSVTEIYGLRAALQQYLAEGPQAVQRRHRAAARAVQAGAEAMGLTLWARDPAIRSDTITAIRMPGGVDERAVRDHARSESGVMLSGGQGDLARIVLQIGHMGLGAYPLGPVLGLTAVGRALRALGAQADIGAAVEAALAAPAD